MTLKQELMHYLRFACIQIIQVNSSRALHQVLVSFRCHYSVSSLMYGIWSLYTLRLSVQGFTPKISAASVILCRLCSAIHKSIAKKVKVLED
jgi:hypothetical protein